MCAAYIISHFLNFKELENTNGKTKAEIEAEQADIDEKTENLSI